MITEEIRRLVLSSGLFQADWYRSQYLDVDHTGLDPLDHYLQFGSLLKRNPGPGFDSRRYLDANPDVAMSECDPVVHYLQFGAREGRRRYPVQAISGKELLANGGCAHIACDPIVDYLGSKEDGAKVVFVVNSFDRMTQVYRVHNLMPELARFGFRSAVIHQSKLITADLSDVGILILCRVAASFSQLQKIRDFRKLGGRVIFDVDDLVFDPSVVPFIRHVSRRVQSERNEFQRLVEGLNRTLKESDLATVSTFPLKLEVERFGVPAVVVPNSSAFEIERALNGGEFDVASVRPGFVRVVYLSGTRSHEVDFEECRAALHRAIVKHPLVEFVVVGELEAAAEFEAYGDRFVRFPLLPHADMLKVLETADINLAPLEWRNPFVNCKSELKIFEAAQLGVPTIASPTASYAALIHHGVDGILAYSESDWFQALDQLILDSDHRRKIADQAAASIAGRFRSSLVAEELSAALRAVLDDRVRPIPRKGYDGRIRARPVISVVGILYRKSQEVAYFLETFRRQSLPLPFEVVLVDDCCPDGSASVVDAFVQHRLPLPDSNPLMQVRVVRNELNSGNCTSRNRGVAESVGDIVVVVDADCLFNRDFLLQHYSLHAQGMCDAVLGPKGIETLGRPPMAVLGQHEADPARAVAEANPQDEINQDSFVNCVTRNLSLRRSFVDTSLNGVLFDEAFNYSAKPDSGFGWEDVELGCRLQAAAARIKFAESTVSIHISHPPTVENQDKPVRSLRNYRRLHEKHRSLGRVSRQWSIRTFEAIERWCLKLDVDVGSLEDYRSLKELLSPATESGVRFSRRRQPLRIATYRWHCPHQYELYRLGGEFNLATGLGTGLCERWEWRQRPMPLNAKLRRLERVDSSTFDLAILHFDENVLDPSICNGKVPSDWGNAFRKALAEWDVPKIAICHGTPQFFGQYDPDFDIVHPPTVIEESRCRLVELLRDTHVVCNSHQAQREWGFAKSSVIWQGFSPHDFPMTARQPGRVLSMSKRAMRDRPHYNGFFVMEEARKRLADSVRIEELCVPDPPSSLVPETNDWAKVKYENYARRLAEYSVYVNPTLRSPMPRTRGEAMLAGLVSVSMRNHDVDMFIRNGVNGFYADSPAELADQIRFLGQNEGAWRKMSTASRDTALDVFNQDRYLSDWSSLIRSVIA